MASGVTLLGSFLFVVLHRRYSTRTAFSAIADLRALRPAILSLT
jgi:hypothetical protein